MLNGQIQKLAITAAIFLVLQNIVFFTAFGILGGAIGWPGSLDLPAAESLPLIRENAEAVFQGYYIYLMSVIITLPMWVLTRQVLLGRMDAISRVTFDLVVYLCIAAVSAKALGILRWLFAMPYLAKLLESDPSSQPMVTMMFDILNLYAGKAGEHLGVQLFSSLYTLCAGFALTRMSGTFRLLGIAGIIVGILFLPYGDLLGLDNGIFLTVSGFANTAWTIALAFVLIMKRKWLGSGSAEKSLSPSYSTSV